jgi:hypothetical protein
VALADRIGIGAVEIARRAAELFLEKSAGLSRV